MPTDDRPTPARDDDLDEIRRQRAEARAGLAELRSNLAKSCNAWVGGEVRALVAFTVHHIPELGHRHRVAEVPPWGLDDPPQSKLIEWFEGEDGYSNRLCYVGSYAVEGATPDLKLIHRQFVRPAASIARLANAYLGRRLAARTFGPRMNAVDEPLDWIAFLCRLALCRPPGIGYRAEAFNNVDRPDIQPPEWRIDLPLDGSPDPPWERYGRDPADLAAGQARRARHLAAVEMSRSDDYFDAIDGGQNATRYEAELPRGIYGWRLLADARSATMQAVDWVLAEGAILDEALARGERLDEVVVEAVAAGFDWDRRGDHRGGPRHAGTRLDGKNFTTLTRIDLGDLPALMAMAGEVVAEIPRYAARLKSHGDDVMGNQGGCHHLQSALGRLLDHLLGMAGWPGGPPEGNGLRFLGDIVPGPGLAASPHIRGVREAMADLWALALSYWVSSHMTDRGWDFNGARRWPALDPEQARRFIESTADLAKIREAVDRRPTIHASGLDATAATQGPGIDLGTPWVQFEAKKPASPEHDHSIWRGLGYIDVSQKRVADFREFTGNQANYLKDMKMAGVLDFEWRAKHRMAWVRIRSNADREALLREMETERAAKQEATKTNPRRRKNT